MSAEYPYKKNFAMYYDLLYQDKDYIKECDLIEDIVKEYSSDEIKTILDAGCGTGNHTIPLAKRGYEILAFDRSEGMLNIAKQKVPNRLKNIEFVVSDLRHLFLNKKFDLALVMFAVLSFQLSNGDLYKALQSLHNHIKPGRLLICDVWYGPAVLGNRPENRLKVCENDKIRLLRFSKPQLNTFEHTNVIEHNFIIIDKKSSEVVIEVKEQQIVRYFYPQEISFFFEQAGFEILKFFCFPHIDKPISDNDWELGIIARALEAGK